MVIEYINKLYIILKHSLQDNETTYTGHMHNHSLVPITHKNLVMQCVYSLPYVQTNGSTRKTYHSLIFTWNVIAIFETIANLV